MDGSWPLLYGFIFNPFLEWKVGRLHHLTIPYYLYNLAPILLLNNSTIGKGGFLWNLFRQKSERDFHRSQKLEQVSDKAS